LALSIDAQAASITPVGSHLLGMSGAAKFAIVFSVFTLVIGLSCVAY
jgi:hypothetical protein